MDASINAGATATNTDVHREREGGRSDDEDASRRAAKSSHTTHKLRGALTHTSRAQRTAVQRSVVAVGRREPSRVERGPRSRAHGGVRRQRRPSRHAALSRLLLVGRLGRQPLAAATNQVRCQVCARSRQSPSKQRADGVDGVACSRPSASSRGHG